MVFAFGSDSIPAGGRIRRVRDAGFKFGRVAAWAPAAGGIFPHKLGANGLASAFGPLRTIATLCKVLSPVLRAG